MINVLPADLKESYLYAHRNTRLRRWVWTFAAGIGGLIAITVIGVFYMQQSIHNLNSDVDRGQTALASQDVDEVKQKTTEISNNLKLVVQVLSNEVLFSQLLKQIGAITPSNVVLTGLSISKIQGGVDLTIASADYNAATQFQVNLQDPRNKIFSKADLVSITCSTSSSDPRYPCNATIRALFNASNPFLFINNKAAKP